MGKKENLGGKSTGYVVGDVEASIWSMIVTGDFRECLLAAVNLGDDADTVGAVAGGLAGLYYGYESIPAEWLDVIQRREWIEDMCGRSLLQMVFSRENHYYSFREALCGDISSKKACIME